MFKKVWLIASVLMLILVPLKIASSFNTLAFVESGWFTTIFLLMILGIGLMAKLENIDIKNIEVKKNIPLGIISLVLSAGFFWCIFTYYNDTFQYDFEWQPIVMALLSILAGISFIIMAATYFMGKNLFSKASFFIFCPVFWFAFNMILFLSIQNDNSDIYDITFTALLSLFFLYYTQVFSTCSKLNIVKLLVGLGTPTVVLMFVKCVPIIVEYIQKSDKVTAVGISTASMEAVAGIYIGLVLWDTMKQITEKRALVEE